MIVVFSTDRAWRGALDRALRAQGMECRVASRPAELAKCLAQPAVGLVITGPDDHSHALAVPTVTSLAPHLQRDQRLLAMTPGDTMDDIVRRALAFTMH